MESNEGWSGRGGEREAGVDVLGDGKFGGVWRRGGV